MQSQYSREEIVAQVKEQADIVQVIGEVVDLKRSGARLLGLCPFHGEKTPSFSVHPGQQFFKCFGCGESGDVFSFMMKYHGLDFPEALRELARKYSITLPEPQKSRETKAREQEREALFHLNDRAATLYHHYLLNTKEAAPAREYLQSRQISEATISRYRLGYAPAVEQAGWNFLGSRLHPRDMEAAILSGLLVKKDKGGTYDRFRDRIMFPIADIGGRTCGFGGRIVGDGQPKYLNSPESPVFNKSASLFGLFQQKEAVRRQDRAVLVEGNFDLLAMVDRGLENVVAPLGTALTREQLRMLKRFASQVVLLFDGDSAGLNAAVRAVPLFLAEQVGGAVALLPPGQDPDSYCRQEGADKLAALIGAAESLPEFALSQLIAQFGLTLDGKSRIVEELRPLVKAAASPLHRALFVSHFASQLEMDKDELDRLLESPRTIAWSNEQASPPKIQEKVTPLTAAQRQLVEFMLLNPDQFTRLAAAGIRQTLAGTMGEIFFLQLQNLMADGGEVEPEDLLNALGEGAERSFVVTLLARAGNKTPLASLGERESELADLLDYLQRQQLKERIASLVARMEEVNRQGDYQLLQELMSEKVALSRRLHGEDL